jgi:hypothetical protein
MTNPIASNKQNAVTALTFTKVSEYEKMKKPTIVVSRPKIDITGIPAILH